MKRQRKNPAKKVAKKPRANPRIHPEKFLRAAIKGELRERAKQIPLAARLAAAELKAARLEEKLVLEDRLHNELIVKWQDTVKLRDEAIGRSKDQINSLQAECQQLASQVTELTGMQEGLAPSGLQYGKVLEAEVEARKRVQEERDLAIKRAIEDESTIAELANEVARLRGELARYNTPAQPVPEPHHQVAEWTLTFADLVEFSRLFKPREGG